MATNKYQVVEVLSDISGEKGASTVTYSVNGQAYSIDLTEPEAKEFHNLFAPYIAVSAVGKRRGPRIRSTPEETAKIRDWAKANGLPLTPAGRVPSDTRQAYLEAQANGTLVEAPVKKAPVRKAAAKKAPARKRPAKKAK